MANPSDLATVEEIQFMTGLRVEPVLSTAVEIERAIDRYYNNSLQPAAMPQQPVQSRGRSTGCAHPEIAFQRGETTGRE